MNELLTSDNNPLSAQATRQLRIGVSIILIVIALAVATALVRRQHLRTLRTQVGGAVLAADGMRLAVALYRARNGGAWPYDNSQAGLLSLTAANGKYLDDAHIENGRIVITLGGQADPALRGKQVVLTPYLAGPLVLWRCASPDIGRDLLPGNCR